MKKIIAASLPIVFAQLSFAQDIANPPKSQKKEGCVYGDIFYNVGEKHRVQQSVTDPVTHKVTMVDLKPEILQECIEDTNAEKTKSPQFYWRTLLN
jgi:hypothetical protein